MEPDPVPVPVPVAIPAPLPTPVKIPEAPSDAFGDGAKVPFEGYVWPFVALSVERLDVLVVRFARSKAALACVLLAPYTRTAFR